MTTIVGGNPGDGHVFTSTQIGRLFCDIDFCGTIVQGHGRGKRRFHVVAGTSVHQVGEDGIHKRRGLFIFNRNDLSRSSSIQSNAFGLDDGPSVGDSPGTLICIVDHYLGLVCHGNAYNNDCELEIIIQKREANRTTGETFGYHFHIRTCQILATDTRDIDIGRCWI